MEDEKIKKYLDRIFRKLNKIVEYNEKTKEFSKI